MSVHRSNDSSFFIARDGGKVMELINPQTCSLDTLSIARVRVEPGVRAEPHWHERTEEVYYVISGCATAYLDEERFELGAGDALFIPRGSVHNLENRTEHPIDYLAISTPAYDESDMCWPDKR